MLGGAQVGPVDDQPQAELARPGQGEQPPPAVLVQPVGPQNQQVLCMFAGKPQAGQLPGVGVRLHPFGFELVEPLAEGDQQVQGEARGAGTRGGVADDAARGQVVQACDQVMARGAVGRV
jgi:hypothetical protein